jgi:murein DD-endopeptidase MepM/ murein hydrolase activator NlpD
MMRRLSFFIILFVSFQTGCLPANRLTETATAAAIRTLPARPTPTMIGENCLARANFSDPSRSLYILPYPVGEKYTIDQGYCTFGRSHADQLAYDFGMELGDDVLAARSGQVVEVVENFSDDDANASHFNYVFIRHEDGTAAFYAHLLQNGVLVEMGDAVEAGQVIARVGHSGMPANYRSVLHFGVYASWPVGDGKDVAVNFRNTDGPFDLRNGLAAGREYKALPWIP